MVTDADLGMLTDKDIRFFDAEQSPEPPHKYTFAK